MSRSLAAAVLVLLAAPSFAQTPAPTPAPAADPAPDPGLPDKLKDLKTMVSQPKMEDDFRAVDLIHALVKEPAKLNSKDKDKLAKALGDVYRTGKQRPPDKAHLYRETAQALATLGTDGGPQLQKAITDARLKGREYAALRGQMLVELGHTKDE